MNKIARYGAFAILPFLAACFDLEQGLVVESDGQATLSIEIAVSTEMMEMMAAMGEGNADGEASAPPSLCEDLDTDDIPESFTVTSEEFERDGDTVCRTVAVGPIEELAAEMPDEIENGDGTALISEGNGVYRFEAAMTSSDEGIGDPDEPEIAELFEDRYITFFLTAPRIIETNGEVDGNTASLVIPAIDLMTIDGEVFSLSVRFGL